MVRVLPIIGHLTAHIKCIVNMVGNMVHSHINGFSCVFSSVESVPFPALSAAMLAVTSDIVAARSVPLHTPAAAPPSQAAEVAWTRGCHPIASCKTVVAEVIEERR